MAVAIVVSAVVINNHLLLVNVLAIATIIVARTIDTTIVKTLGITLNPLMPLYPYLQYYTVERLGKSLFIP